MAKKPAKNIPEFQYQRFKSKLEEISKTEHVERNMTLFLIGVSTGYRLQDLEDLTIKDIRNALSDGYFCIQEKKQFNIYKSYSKRYPDKPRREPEQRVHNIEKPLENVLKKYIKGKKNSEYAFFSQKNKNSYITGKSYSAILTKVAKELRIKNISGHSLRKTYATRLYENTNDIEFVRIALGHGSIEVTKRYLELDDNIKAHAAKIAADRM